MAQLEPAVCAVVAGGSVWLAWQWLGRRRGRCGRSCSVAGCLVAGTVVMLPVEGLPLWQWAYSFCPNPSLPLVVLVVLALWRQLGGTPKFQRADWEAAWVFGAVAGTLLYLHPLLAGSGDLYYWGWQHAVAVWTMALLALAALVRGLRFGVVLLGALVAYELSLLESPNAWDYLIDPFYWLLSVALCARRLWGIARRRFTPQSAPGGGISA